MKIFFFFTILFFPLLMFSQERPTRVPSPGGDKPEQEDSLQKPPITAYKIISVKGDTTFVDTTLTIQKDYKFNYLQNIPFLMSHY